MKTVSNDSGSHFDRTPLPCGIGRWPMILSRSVRIWPVLLVTLSSLALSPARSTKPESSSEKPRIEVCFVLDTTGSMGGLLEGAKQKIWSIANEMVSAKPTPALKLGLIGYRDRGDEYVTRTFNLTEDIDAMYAHLREFKADGGGDTPESVNEALDEAIHKMSWSSDKKVLKIVFLVGDAPPHMDYPNSAKYPDLCREAAKKDLIINTVQCGDMAETRPIWQEIARLSEGSYVAIAQSGNMSVVSTPVDTELAKLNERIGATVIPYGSAKLQAEVRVKTEIAAAAPAQAMADRLSFNSKMGKGIQGRGDLVDALNNNELKIESIDSKDLPSEWQALDKDEVRRRIETKRSERADLHKKVVELSKERETYIAAENKRLAKEGKGDAFDTKVSETLRQQAAKKGINY
ncbi:MAG: vWA domain-containing protein [Chthoniobacterales bacterium]